MKKINEMISEYKTKRNAKKYGRSLEWQDYRDKLAQRLKDGKKEGKSKEELAEILGKEQGTVKYAEMMINCGRVLDDDLANKLIESGHRKRVKQNLSKFKQLDEKTINRIEIFEKIEKEIERKKQQERKELEDNLSPNRKIVGNIKEIGGKPCYIIKNQNPGRGADYGVMRGDKCLCPGEIKEIIGEIREIGGKPCFEFKRIFNVYGGNMITEYRSKGTGRSAICRGEKILGYFDEILYINYDGGVPIFKAKTYGCKHSNGYGTWQETWTYLISGKDGILSRTEKTRFRNARTGEISESEKTN